MYLNQNNNYKVSEKSCFILVQARIQRVYHMTETVQAGKGIRSGW